MAKMDHQRRHKLPRWDEAGLQLGYNLTMDWSSYLASIVYVRCYQMQGCLSEEVVWFFYLSWFIFSSIHRNTLHPNGVHERLAQQSSSFQRSFMTVFTRLNNWQLITCTMFHFPPGEQQNQYQHWKTRSYAKLAPFFPSLRSKWEVMEVCFHREQ